MVLAMILPFEASEALARIPNDGLQPSKAVLVTIKEVHAASLWADVHQRHVRWGLRAWNPGKG